MRLVKPEEREKRERVPVTFFPPDTPFIGGGLVVNTLCLLGRSTRGAGAFSYELPLIPKSVNHQYIRRGKGRRYDLDPEIKRLRDETREILRGKPFWRPTGVTAALIVFYSPRWVTKDGHVRRIDVDNKVKAVLDAFENVTGVGDERNWTVMAHKVVSSRERTSVSLFDLGIMIEREIE